MASMKHLSKSTSIGIAAVLVVLVAVSWLIYKQTASSDSSEPPTHEAPGSEPLAEATVERFETVTTSLAEAGTDCDELIVILRQLETVQKDLEASDPSTGEEFAERGEEALERLVNELNRLQPSMRRCALEPGFIEAVEAP